MPNPGTPGRLARWAAVLGIALGFGLSAAQPIDADAGPRKKGKPAVVATRGRAEPIKSRKRQRLAPPAIERVAIAASAANPDEQAEVPRASAATAAATAIDKLLRGPLRYGTTALYVVDADTGRELFSLRPDERLNPASNVKMISTAAALDLLGPDYRYRTRLLGAGPDADGNVTGDVYLHGSYDPTLTADGLDDLAAQVAAGGVKTITGDVVVGSIATRDGLYRSRVTVDVSAGLAGAAPRVEVSPAYDFVEVRNEARSGKRPKVKGGIAVTSKVETRADGRQRLVVTVRGMIGKGKHVAQTIYTKERALHAAHLLRAALARHGVTIAGDVAVRELPAYVDAMAADGRLPVALGEHRSAALADIVALVNKRSINWLSDRVIATAALDGTAETPSMTHAVDAMYGWLDRRVGIARADALVDTGSGLSHRTQLSARQLVRVLRTASGLTAHGADDEARLVACGAAFTHSLSVGGVDGTLRGRFKAGGLRGRVIGKTGTLSDSIALSGLLTGPGERRLAFSLVTNGHDRSRKRSIRSAHEQVLAILDGYLAATATSAPAPVAAVTTVPDEPADPVAHTEDDEESTSPDDDQ